MKKYKSVLLLSLLAFCVWMSGLNLPGDAKDIQLIYSIGCPPKMAVSIDLGRIGNQFFEYLAARLMADSWNVELFISRQFSEVYDRYFIGRRNAIVDWNYLQHRCGILESQCETVPLEHFSDSSLVHRATDYRCIAFEGYPMNITLETWRAIYSKRDEFIKEFQWKTSIRKEIKRKFDKLRGKYKTIVGVHIRRTDFYIYLVEYFGTFHPANVSYYNKAMDHFRKKYEKCIFLIFSDDMNWCRKHLNGPDIMYAGSGKHADPGDDLALLSSCDHLILSYGTFGLMAAWFNGHGEVVIADNYTQRPEIMGEHLKRISTLKWMWMSV